MCEKQQHRHTVQIMARKAIMQLERDGKRQYTHEKQLLYGGKDTYFDQFGSHH